MQAISTDRIYHPNVFVGVGANLDEPAAQVEKALAAMSGIDATQLIRRSSLYGSPPMGPPDQPDYVNAVAQLATNLSAIRLLAELQAIENQFGRVRLSERWGPRVIDLDLLLFDGQIINSDQLTVPHPGMLARSFVIQPLLEIAPEIELPNGQTVAASCERFSETDCWIIQRADAQP